MAKTNWGDVLPPAISAVGGLVSGIFNRNQERREYDRMLKYNSPKAQMQRYREAGLSPYLIYGQGSSGNVSSPSPAQAIPETDGLGKYMGYKGFSNEQQMFALNRNAQTIANRNALTSGSILSNQERSTFTDSIRKELEFYADFPALVGKNLERVTTGDLSHVASNSFRQKMNELKRQASEASISKIQEAIRGMKSDNIVRGVKATYARDYGMVGGDWTQGLGLIKSLPSFFRSRAKTPVRQFIPRYNKSGNQIN